MVVYMQEVKGMPREELQPILEQIAKAHNTTPEHVYHEMQTVIDIAQNDPDPETQEKWKYIPKLGGQVTVEEFLSFMVLILKRLGY